MTDQNNTPAPQTRAEARANQTPNRWVPSTAARLWIYGIAVAVAALLIGYGILTVEQGGLWLSLIGAILGTGNALAARNVPRG